MCSSRAWRGSWICFWSRLWAVEAGRSFHGLARSARDVRSRSVPPRRRLNRAAPEVGRVLQRPWRAACNVRSRSVPPRRRFSRGPVPSCSGPRARCVQARERTEPDSRRLSCRLLSFAPDPRCRPLLRPTGARRILRYEIGEGQRPAPPVRRTVPHVQSLPRHVVPPVVRGREPPPVHDLFHDRMREWQEKCDISAGGWTGGKADSSAEPGDAKM
jgi:hypothetical protein